MPYLRLFYISAAFGDSKPAGSGVSGRADHGNKNIAQPFAFIILTGFRLIVRLIEWIVNVLKYINQKSEVFLMNNKKGMTLDCVVESPRTVEKVRDPMKFRNGGITLEEAIKRNGGRVVMANMSALLGNVD